MQQMTNSTIIFSIPLCTWYVNGDLFYIKSFEYSHLVGFLWQANVGRSGISLLAAG